MALNHEPMDERLEERRLDETAVDDAATGSGECDSAGEMAAHLDEYVDHLMPGLAKQPNPYAHNMYVDLMMGLTLLADSVRARSRGDLASADGNWARAAECLERVSLDEIVLDGDDEFGLRHLAVRKAPPHRQNR